MTSSFSSLSTSSLHLDPGSRRTSPNFNRKTEWNCNVHQYKVPPQKAKMSITKSEEFNTPAYLSWRKLQLSRHKLKNSGKTSALLSGFAMVSIVDVQITGAHLPGEFLIALAICTTLLVAVHMLALMISTCISPNIDAVSSLDSINLVDESPHESLHWYIELAWAFSTLLGLLLFIIEVAMLCYVKFHQINETAAWVACVILVPVLLIFLIFAVHFYRTLVTHKYKTTCSGIKELEMIKEQIEQQNSLEGRAGGIGEMYTVRVV